MRRAGVLSFLAGLAATAFAHPAPERLTPEEAQRDVRVLKRALSELHPALTKYRTRAEIDAAFAAFEARGHAARTPAEMYLAATELAAAIRCGHTWTNVLNQRDGSRKALLEAGDKLPLTLDLVQGRWLVLASATPQVKPGDEILAFGGAPGGEVVRRMMPYLRADGGSDGKRSRQLSHDRGDYSQMDVVWPLLAPPSAGAYVLSVRSPGRAAREVRVEAVTLEARAAALAEQKLPPRSEAWRLDVDGDVAVLTLPTFAFWNKPFDWAQFLDQAFAKLNAASVPHLVVDIRANEGGDIAIGARLLSHLPKRPFRYTADQSTTAYERVPYILAKHLDTWDYGFFDRTGRVEKITTGPQACLYTFKPRAFGERVIEPVLSPYAGKAWLLIGPENSSATFSLALLAQRSGAATLLGEPTGGNERGLNGGELVWVTLPHSGVAVDIPLLATTYQEDTKDASVTPDLLVPRTFAGVAAGRDEQMEAVLEAIRRGRPKPMAHPAKATTTQAPPGR